MLSRRRFLAGASGGLVVAAFSRSWTASAPGPAPVLGAQLPEPQRQSGLPYQLVAPGIGTDGFHPDIQLSQTTPYQGGAILVTVGNALSGTATVFGREYQLAPGPEGLAGFVGFGTIDPVGPTTLAADVIDQMGQPVSAAYAITVQATQWTYDDIYIPPPPPPDPNATPSTKPPLENEQPQLDALYATVTPRAWSGPWIIPIDLGGEVWISGYFGEQRSFNGGPRGGHHGGTDIAAPAGAPVRATNHGTVVLAEETLIRGFLVVVDHGAGVLSSYGHMQELRAAVGDTVSRGDTVGLVGTTGLSTGPHLHWELAVAGILVDGLRWLDGTQGF